MSSVGFILRQERERQGLDLERIAQLTRISPRYLEAIEADDLAGLPGGFFYRSFVRQYAQSLGLEENALQPEFDQILQADTAASQRMQPIREPVDVPPLPSTVRSSTPNRLPLALVLLVTAIVASSGLYALWQRFQQGSVSEPRTEAAAPAQTTEPPLQPTAQPAQPVEPPPPAVPTIEVLATENAWISIKVDGNEVVSRTLQPGESRKLSGTQRVTLLTGNAGGIVVTANGKVLEPIGPRGHIRTVDITPQGVTVRDPGTDEEDEPQG